MEAVIDTAASSLVVSPEIGRKLGIFKRASEARILQADGGTLKGGKIVVNSSFKFLNSSSQILSPKDKKCNRYKSTSSVNRSRSSSPIVSINECYGAHDSVLCHSPRASDD